VGIVQLLGDDSFTGVLDLVGIAVGATLGAAAAAHARFDVTGTLALAITCGLGGGVIRDVLLSQGPPLALLEPSYVATALLAAAVMLVVDVPGWRHGRRMLDAGDALLLGFFTAAGCQRAASVGLAPIPVALMGIVTAVGGGMLRDVLVGRQPQALTGGTLYASVAIAAAVVYAIMDALDASRGMTTLSCILVGVVLRGSALRWGITTPTTPQPLDPTRIVHRRRGGGQR
jgi:uncharacterized membrane protein YeiH